MKNKIFIGGLLTVIVIIALACNQRQEAAMQFQLLIKRRSKAENSSTWKSFCINLYNKRSADSLTYYADDAVSYFAGQKPVVGKAAIHKFIENELMDFPKGAKISFETVEN